MHIKCIKNCLHNTHSQLLCLEYKKNLGCCFFHLISRSHINSISLSTQCNVRIVYTAAAESTKIAQKSHFHFSCVYHSGLYFFGREMRAKNKWRVVMGCCGWEVGCIRIFNIIPPFLAYLCCVCYCCTSKMQFFLPDSMQPPQEDYFSVQTIAI